MKKSLFALSLVAVCVLTACSGSGTSYEKFAEEANKIEDHQYTSATVHIVETAKGKQLDSEQFEKDAAAALLGDKKVTLKTVDVDEKVDVTYQYTYNAEEKEWQPAEGSDKEAKYYTYMVEGNLKTDVVNYDPAKMNGGEGSLGFELKYNLTFYVNPFKVDVKASGQYTRSTESVENSEETADMFEMLDSFKMDITGSATWDKYGFQTLTESSTKSTTTYSADFFKSIGEMMGVEVSLGDAKTTTVTETSKTTISYK